jgi:hypothetical protein
MGWQYVGKRKILRLDRRTLLCLFGPVTFSRRPVPHVGTHQGWYCQFRPRQQPFGETSCSVGLMKGTDQSRPCEE